jgi:hypothetical protein
MVASGRDQWWRSIWTQVIAALIVAALIPVGAQLFKDRDNQQGSPTPSRPPTSATPRPPVAPTIPTTSTTIFPPSSITTIASAPAVQSPARLGRDIEAASSDTCHRPGNTGNTWETGSFKINGTQFGHVLYCSAQNGAIGYQDFVLGRSYETFTVTVGIADHSENITDEIEFNVYGDGAALASHRVRYAESQHIEAPISGVLRLRIEMVKLTTGDKNSVPAWGDPLVKV